MLSYYIFVKTDVSKYLFHFVNYFWLRNIYRHSQNTAVKYFSIRCISNQSDCWLGVQLSWNLINARWCGSGLRRLLMSETRPLIGAANRTVNQSAIDTRKQHFDQWSCGPRWGRLGSSPKVRAVTKIVEKITCWKNSCPKMPKSGVEKLSFWGKFGGKIKILSIMSEMCCCLVESVENVQWRSKNLNFLSHLLFYPMTPLILTRLRDAFLFSVRLGSNSVATTLLRANQRSYSASCRFLYRDGDRSRLHCPVLLQTRPTQPGRPFMYGTDAVATCSVYRFNGLLLGGRPWSRGKLLSDL